MKELTNIIPLSTNSKNVEPPKNFNIPESLKLIRYAMRDYFLEENAAVLNKRKFEIIGKSSDSIL